MEPEVVVSLEGVDEVELTDEADTTPDCPLAGQLLGYAVMQASLVQELACKQHTLVCQLSRSLQDCVASILGTANTVKKYKALSQPSPSCHQQEQLCNSSRDSTHRRKCPVHPRQAIS